MRRSVWVTLLAMLLSLVLTQVARAGELVATYPVGQQPFAVVSDAATGRLYVANNGTRSPDGTGTISVVDPATGGLATLTTTQMAGVLAIDSAARRLYSSNADASGSALSLDVFDLDSGARVQSFAGIGGLGVALDDTRSKIYASSGRFLVALDTRTFDMNVLSAPSGHMWFGAAADRARGRVYLANAAASSLVVVDANSLSVVANIPLPVSPRFALAVDEVGNRVFVAGNDPATGTSWAVARVDGATFAITTVSFSGFPGGIVHDPAADRVLVTGGRLADGRGESTVTALGEEDLATLSVTPLPWQPMLAAFGRDRLLYVAGHSAGVLGAVSVDDAANAAPVIDRVVVTPLSAATNDTLTATVDAHDPDGDPFTVSYQWGVNGVAVPDATARTYSLAESGHGDRGDSICLTVTVADAERSTTASSCLEVQDTAPVASLSLDSTTPATDAVLHATATASDVDGDPVTFEFTWRRNGVVVRTATGTSSDHLDLSLPGNGDAGDTVTVTVVPSDGTLSGAAVAASATVANSAPSVTMTLSDTEPWRHDVLVATASASDRDAQALTVTFCWRVDGTVTLTTSDTSATSALDLDAFNVDNRAKITVDVVVSDGSATASASASATVTPPGQ